MREILFRGKRMDNGEWVEGYVFDNDFVDDKRYFVGSLLVEPNGGAKSYDFDVTGMKFCEVDPETICQYTGLIDKNGKKIWEGDIVGYWDTYSTENGLSEAYCFGKVVWDDETMSFQVTNRLSAKSYEVLDECSVIGNVFDNPELLEESHD